MNLILLNLQSNQQIKLDNDNPLIIGRSNVLGCADKRVSRNHGKVTCTADGKIHLVALHTNPCFFNRNGAPPIIQLNKDGEETLSEGDCLGLLPDEFWFQITSETKPNLNIENHNPNESTSETDSGKKCVTKSPLQNNKKTSSENLIVKEDLRENKNSISSQVNTFNSVNEPNVESCDSLVGNLSEFTSSEFEKTRKLPIWMYEIHEAKNEKKSPAKRISSSVAEQKNKRPKVFPGTSNIKKELLLSNTCTDVNNKKIDLNSASTSRIPAFIESVEEIKSEKESSKESLGEESNPLKQEKGGYENDGFTGNVSIRPFCQYDGKCYRKNPQHKLDFSHPGDADFVAYENRPLCPYGSTCYRKNERHKINYRHPLAGSYSPSSSSCSSRVSSPLPSKRRRETIKIEDSYFGSEDEYALEDPFTNDASSDEYIPSDLNSEEDKEELNFSLTDDD